MAERLILGEGRRYCDPSGYIGLTQMFQGNLQQAAKQTSIEWLTTNRQDEYCDGFGGLTPCMACLSERIRLSGL